MVDALVSETSAARRGGSNPLIRTMKKARISIRAFFMALIEGLEPEPKGVEVKIARGNLQDDLPVRAVLAAAKSRGRQR